MNIDNQLDELKKIKQVDAPPFLLTRIRQQIHNLNNQEAPVQWKWAFAFTAVLILVLNLSAFLKQNHTDATQPISSIVTTLNLSNSNALYNE